MGWFTLHHYSGPGSPNSARLCLPPLRLSTIGEPRVNGEHQLRFDFLGAVPSMIAYPLLRRRSGSRTSSSWRVSPSSGRRPASATGGRRTKVAEDDRGSRRWRRRARRPPAPRARSTSSSTDSSPAPSSATCACHCRALLRQTAAGGGWQERREGEGLSLFCRYEQSPHCTVGEQLHQRPTTVERRSATPQPKPPQRRPPPLLSVVPLTESRSRARRGRAGRTADGVSE